MSRQVNPWASEVLPPVVADSICWHLPWDETLLDSPNDRLRLVCRAFRDAFSSSPTQVTCCADTPMLQHDIAVVFPNVVKLTVTTWKEREPPQTRTEQADRQQQALLFSQLASSLPLLLGKLKQLHIDARALDADCLHGLVARCTSLDTLTVSLPTLKATLPMRLASSATNATARAARASTDTRADPAQHHTNLHQLLTTLGSPSSLLCSPVAPHCCQSLALDLTKQPITAAATLAPYTSTSNPTQPPTSPKQPAVPLPVLPTPSPASHDPASSNAVPQAPLPLPGPPPPAPSSFLQPHSICLLHTVPQLSSLTHLHITLGPTDSPDRCTTPAPSHSPEYQATLYAAAHTPHLQALGITGPGRQHSTCPAASHWAPLTRLTRLSITHSWVPAATLAPLANLRSLSLHLWRGEAQQLYSLTALTYLSLGGEHQEYEHIESSMRHGALTTALPQAWCTGLRHLEWKFRGQLQPAALGMLSALTCVALRYQVLPARLAGVLASLPSLQLLTAADTQPQSLPEAPPPPVPLRAAFQSLRELRGFTPALLNVLARWTRLPAAAAFQLGAVYGDHECHPVARLQEWSPCWLNFLLHSCSGDDHHLLFLDAADVAAFCGAAAVGGDKGGRLRNKHAVLHIGPQLPPAAFRQLVLAARGLFTRWDVDGWGTLLATNQRAWAAWSSHFCRKVPNLAYLDVEVMPSQFVQLTPAHVHGLPAHSLVNLGEIKLDCDYTDLATVLALLDAAPWLGKLWLAAGEKLPPQQLTEVCVRAAKLQVLWLASLEDSYGLQAEHVRDVLLAAAAGQQFELELAWKSWEHKEEHRAFNKKLYRLAEHAPIWFCINYSIGTHGNDLPLTTVSLRDPSVPFVRSEWME